MQSLSEPLSFPSCLFQMLFTLRKKKFWGLYLCQKSGLRKRWIWTGVCHIKSQIHYLYSPHHCSANDLVSFYVWPRQPMLSLPTRQAICMLNVNKPSILIFLTHPHCFHWMQRFRASDTFYQWKLQYPNLNALICKGLNISAHCVKSISINALNYHEKKYLYEKFIHDQI